MRSVLLILATLLWQSQASDHWAVIVVGSKGYWNYRHSADACHAYHQAISNGIPPSQVILIAAGIDEIAYSQWNPYPGKLFNKPTKEGEEGVDVYENCRVDYKGSLATKETVLAVLQGDEAYRKVLKSNENSKVFFFFTDHGAPGLLEMSAGHKFGNLTNRVLYADEFHKAVRYMHENKMYKEMTIYVGACESGSMFEGILESDLGVYAVSSTNSKESGWGTYCHPSDMVNGKSIGSCLGDLFAVSWMENADQVNLNQETLQEQFEIVKNETDKSHVMQWGQLDIASEPIAEFQADGRVNYKKMIQTNSSNHYDRNQCAIPSRDVKLHYLQVHARVHPSPAATRALRKELVRRQKIDTLFREAAGKESFVEEKASLVTDFNCYRDLIAHLEASCGPIDSYALKHFKILVAQCQDIDGIPDFKVRLSAACRQITSPTRQAL